MAAPAEFSGDPQARREPHILVVPFPAQGHMLPLLDLAHLLSSRHRLAVTIAVTEKNVPRIEPLLARTPAIRPLVLSLPPHPALPAGVENAHNLPISFVRPLMAAFGGIHGQLLDWGRSSTSPPTAIVSDFFSGWTNRLGRELGVPNLVFSPSGAFALCVMFSVWLSMPERRNCGDEYERFVIGSVRGSPEFPWCQLPYLYRTFEAGESVSEFIKDGFLECLGSYGFVVNTFEGLEGVFLENLRGILGSGRVWGVGPLAPPVGDARGRGGRSEVREEEVRGFLDGCERGSVVYACFGSQAVFSAKAAVALAEALDRSGAQFVWCVKEGAGPPGGFEGRTKGQGIVVRGWAPQVMILGHDSVGSFVTHCGWNSILEAVAAGVAMLTWPLSADQFFNARLVKELGIGTEACEGGLEAVPDSDELARVIAESVGDSGREMRERAMEMGRKAKAAVEPDGSSYKDLEDLVNHISNFKH